MTQTIGVIAYVIQCANVYTITPFNVATIVFKGDIVPTIYSFSESTVFKNKHYYIPRSIGIQILCS